jgi:hypothetical protein
MVYVSDLQPGALIASEVRDDILEGTRKYLTFYVKTECFLIILNNQSQI